MATQQTSPSSPATASARRSSRRASRRREAASAPRPGVDSPSCPGAASTTCRAPDDGEDGFERLATFDAIYLGAIGAPASRTTSRCGADPADPAALRSVRQPAADAPAAGPRRAAGATAAPPTSTWSACARTPRASTPALGGRIHRGTPHEVAEQTGVFTRHGIERIVRYAFELAAARPRKMLASATKSNALQHSMVLWDEVVEMVAQDYPDVTTGKYHVDALAARMVTHPADARRDRRVEPVRRHPHRPRLGDLRQPRHRAGREHQPGARRTRRCSSRSTARRRTSPARASPTRSARSGPAALMLEHLGHRDLHDRDPRRDRARRRRRQGAHARSRRHGDDA